MPAAVKRRWGKAVAFAALLVLAVRCGPSRAPTQLIVTVTASDLAVDEYDEVTIEAWRMEEPDLKSTWRGTKLPFSVALVPAADPSKEKLVLRGALWLGSGLTPRVTKTVDSVMFTVGKVSHQAIDLRANPGSGGSSGQIGSGGAGVAGARGLGGAGGGGGGAREAGSGLEGGDSGGSGGAPSDAAVSSATGGQGATAGAGRDGRASGGASAGGAPGGGPGLGGVTAGTGGVAMGGSGTGGFATGGRGNEGGAVATGGGGSGATGGRGVVGSGGATLSCTPACATYPNTTSTCTGGNCTYACSPTTTGYDNCNPSAPDCETNVKGSDVNNCGACGMKCMATGATCNMGTCSGGGCSAGSLSDGFVMPNPPGTGLPNPASYDTSVAGVVTDNVTGLMWQRTASSGTYMNAAAISYCVGDRTGGFSDWHLPTVLELVSIVDFTVLSPGPALDSNAFLGTAGPVLDFWTSSQYAGTAGRAWVIFFDNGYTSFGNLDSLLRARCVRQATTACYPSPRFTVQGTGSAATVTDAATKLVWQQTPSAATMVWEMAKTYCPNTFRLPSLKELQTIVDHTVPPPGPTIYSSVFPNTPADYYWTSTPYTPGTAWFVYFGYGGTNNITAANSYRVRCVR